MPHPSAELWSGETSDPYVIMWLLTQLGVYYYMPDMLIEHVDEVHRQLTSDLSQITLRNISGVAMVVPKRILKAAGVGPRCFWEA